MTFSKNKDSPPQGYGLQIVSFWMFILIGMGAFSVNPVFPQEGLAFGASIAQCGFVVGMSDFFSFLTGPMIVKYGSRMSLMRLYNVGAVLMAVGLTLFGTITYSPNTLTFLIVSGFLRATNGIGESITVCSLMTKLMHVLPQKRGQILGTAQTAIGIGFLLGPMVAIQLVTYIAFFVPFTLLGLTQLLLLPVLNASMPAPEDLPYKNLDSGEEIPEPMTTLVKKPLIILPMISIFFNNLSLGAVIALISVRVETLGYGESGLTSFFVSLALCSILLRVLTSRVSDYDEPFPTLCTIFFHLCGFIGSALLGPFAWAFPSLTQASLLGSTLFFGASNCSLISTCSRAQEGIQWEGIHASEATTLRVQSLWNSMFFLGISMGAVTSGIIVQLLSFEHAMLASMVYCLLGIAADSKALLCVIRAKS